MPLLGKDTQSAAPISPMGRAASMPYPANAWGTSVAISSTVHRTAEAGIAAARSLSTTAPTPRSVPSEPRATAPACGDA
ncbi:hypothetical protein [Sinosporangium album]|uniref:hypothetical protein n=1 Tax=Sinosporangium album TaxID=504805 RepID=UPI00115FA785|nr:hypothetical protein [Sinosporangium album]